MPGVAIPGRAAKGLRISGPFALNVGSTQALGLVQCYPLVPGSATPLLEQRRNQPGSPKNSLSLGARGDAAIVGVDFDGTDDRVDYNYRGFDPANSVQGFSVAAWIRPDVIDQANLQYVWHAHQSGDAAFATQFGIASNTTAVGATQVTVTTTGGTSVTANSPANVLSVGVWAHVIGTWNGGMTASTACTFFVNGRSVATTSVGNGTAPVIAATGSVSLGGRIFDNSRAYNGVIAHVCVYNRVLSAHEAWSLYDPATRWDLYWVPGRRVFFDVGAAAAAGATWRMNLLGIH